MNTHFWKNKRVVVTGAGGFIGRHMVNFLFDEGAMVIAIVSGLAKQKHMFDSKKNIQIVPIDLNDRDATVNATKNVDAIFHFAGLDGGSAYKHTHTHEILQTNTRIALNILDACKVNHISRLLLMSSIEVYPKALSGMVHEKSGESNWFYEEVSGYAWVKRYTEILTKYYHDDSLQIALARVGNVYGPGDDISKGRVIPTFIHQAIENKPIHITVSKNARMTFMYVTDLVRALALLLEKYATGEPVNIIGSQQIDLYTLAKKIVHTMGSKSKIEYDPSDVNKEYVEHSNKKFLGISGFTEHVTLDEGIQAVKENL